MARKRSVPAWYGHEHADAYLLAAAHYLARAATGPVTEPLPPPAASATLYCAFAAEAYVNVALIRTLGDDEYKPLSRIPVRSKYFLASRLGAREEWFAAGEDVLENLDELFTQRNKLVHAQPERYSFVAEAREQEETVEYTDLRNVARWLTSTADAVSRLGRSHGELWEFGRVAGPLLEMDPLLLGFEPTRDGPELQIEVRKLLARLLREDEEHSMEEGELEELLARQDPDWDLEGLNPPP